MRLLKSEALCLTCPPGGRAAAAAVLALSWNQGEGGGSQAPPQISQLGWPEAAADSPLSLRCLHIQPSKDEKRAFHGFGRRLPIAVVWAEKSLVPDLGNCENDRLLLRLMSGQGSLWTKVAIPATVRNACSCGGIHLLAITPRPGVMLWAVEGSKGA